MKNEYRVPMSPEIGWLEVVRRIRLYLASHNEKYEVGDNWNFVETTPHQAVVRLERYIQEQEKNL